MSRLLNIKQVAAYFGVSRRTVYRWMELGYIPQPVKQWGYPRWNEDQILKALEEAPTPKKTASTCAAV